jgi:hypothetical protein
MPHLKCTACKLRVQSPVSGVGELCPGCGSPLEPAGSLGELVGFRLASPDVWWIDDGGDRWDIAVSAALEAPDAR